LNSSPTSQSTCDTPYWAEQDANWNVLGIVNSSGVLTERYEYSAYGLRSPYISAGSNDPFCTAATIASMRFNAGGTIEPWALCEVGHQGLMHDEEDGTVYNRVRYLSTWLNKFLSEDPIGNTDNNNLFEYERSLPTCFCDFTGMLPNPYGSTVTYAPGDPTAPLVCVGLPVYNETPWMPGDFSDRFILNLTITVVGAEVPLKGQVAGGIGAVGGSAVSTACGIEVKYRYTTQVVACWYGSITTFSPPPLSELFGGEPATITYNFTGLGKPFTMVFGVGWKKRISCCGKILYEEGWHELDQTSPITTWYPLKSTTINTN
jgi:RHS repeat-associated protein